MVLSGEKLECGGRPCPRCGKCRDHGARAGAREGAVAGALGIGALAGVSVFLLVIFGPASLAIAVVGAALGTIGGAPLGAAVGAGAGAAFGAAGGTSCRAGICKGHCKKRSKV